jgi:hypothetical protein
MQPAALHLGDFDPACDAVAYADLPAFDKYVLHRTAAMVGLCTLNQVDP